LITKKSTLVMTDWG